MEERATCGYFTSPAQRLLGRGVGSTDEGRCGGGAAPCDPSPLSWTLGASATATNSVVDAVNQIFPIIGALF